MIPDDENRDGIALSSATETLPEYIKGTPPSIESLRSGFDDARSDPHGNDTKCQKDRIYFDGEGQLNSDIRAVLAGRNQPPIYTNRIRPAVMGVLGILENARSDPKAYPRNPNDEGVADVASKALRFIADRADFDEVKQEVAENFLIEGTGAVIAEMDDDGEIIATQIRWREFYADRYSRRNDFMDARFMGIAKWMDAEQVVQRYRIRIEEIGNPMQPGGGSVFGGDKFEDTGDNGSGWINTKRRRVLLVEEYRNMGGEWKRIVYIAAGVLEFGPSPYLDDKGRPANPIIAVSCFVNSENGRYGIVRDMCPIQDEINSARSRNTALGNSRQLVIPDPNNPPMVSEEIAKQAAAAHDGVIPQGYALAPTIDMQQSNLARAQEAKSEIERMGPTPAVLGRQGDQSQSGRARLVLQQAGMTELARPMARLQAWELRVLRAFWDRAKQFKTDEWWIRGTDDSKTPEFLKVNEVVGQQQVQAMVPTPVMGPDGQPMMGEDGQPVMQPTPQIVMEPIVKNRVAEMDVDIILDTTPDTANLQAEVWAELTSLVSNAGGLAAVVTPEFQLMLDLAPLADKARIMEKLEKFREERDQNQVQQLTQQVQQLTAALQAKQEVSQAETASKIEERQATTLGKVASAHKTAAEADEAQARLYAGLGINPLEALMDNQPTQ